MVRKTMLKSSLREIRQSLGRYLAILAIVGLGVGFFAGLRMSQPSMMATGIDYIRQYRLYDFRLLSTLGFTEEDVDYFSRLDGVGNAQGAVFTDFLTLTEDGDEAVMKAHSLTDGVNLPELVAGRMPQAPDECLGDSRYFTEADLGRVLPVIDSNDQDTRDLLAYDGYTIVGLAFSPYYLNYERGTASIGTGSVSAFLYIPLAGFDYEAYHEIFLTLTEPPQAYSDAYDDQVDALQDQLETATEGRAALRYETIYSDAMEEIRDGEAELADGWEEYNSELADATRELDDAYQELMDGEAEYRQGLKDYEQGKADYAEGLQKYDDGVRELEDARRELDDGWTEYHDGKAEADQELEDAYQKLMDGEAEYANGKAEYDDAYQELVDGEAELADGEAELADAQQQLRDAAAQLESAQAELEAGEASYSQLTTLYQSTTQLAQAVGMGDAGTLIAALQSGLYPQLEAQLDMILQAQGSSVAELVGGWTAAEQQLGGSLNEATLAGLRSTLDQGRAEYEAGLQEYRSGLAAYRDGLHELEEAREQLDDGWAQLEDARQELDDARVELNEGWLDYDEGKAEAQQELDKAFRELTDGEVEYADGLRELEEAKQELLDAQQELDDAPGELADARRELDDGWEEYHDGKAEADQEFADARKELEDAQEEIDDAYVKLADLKHADIYALTRRENTGYACFENDTSIIKAISVVFPVFFFLVAALVCMTTMTRMVDEQRTQIGVLKALGYGRGQITGRYLFYAGSAAFMGSVAGYALCSYGLPWVLWEIYDLMYGFAELKFVFDPVLAAISLAAALVCSMGATYLSCRAELSRPAAELIRPKAPKAGQRVFLERVTPLWRRLSFLYKVSVRNVLRYRSRLVMMVLGIGGCTALLVTGFGIRDSIASVVDDQFDQITLYDYSVSFQSRRTEAEAAAYLAQHQWPAENALLVHSGSVDVVAPGGTKSVYVTVSSTGSLEGFLSLHSGETAIPYPDPGEVVVSVGLAENLGIRVGDSIQLRDTDRGTMSVTVSAICDNFVFNYVYVAAETYETQLGRAPDYQSLYLLSSGGADPYEEGAALSEGDDVSSVTVNEATRDRVNNMLSRLDYIVVVVVVCAAALAFIVLYNLTNININERIREIATIKVLGFYQNEVSAYVFREIAMLSALGSLAGLLMGKGLHAFVISQIKVDGMHFPCQVFPVSYLFAIGLTALFTLLITTSMRPRLKRIDMAESLKSIE